MNTYVILSYNSIMHEVSIVVFSTPLSLLICSTLFEYVMRSSSVLSHPCNISDSFVRRRKMNDTYAATDCCE